MRYITIVKTKTVTFLGGVNYLTLRVQFYANEYNLGQTLTPNAGINLTGYHPPRATNFSHQNLRPGDSFSVQNSGPRVEKTKQNPHPWA